jgi:hypothetical protein
VVTPGTPASDSAHRHSAFLETAAIWPVHFLATLALEFRAPGVHRVDKPRELVGTVLHGIGANLISRCYREQVRKQLMFPPERVK